MSTPQETVYQELRRPSIFSRLSWLDYAYVAACLAAALTAFALYHPVMDVYERWILTGSALATAVLGCHWRPWQAFSLVVGALAVFAVSRYPELAAAEQDFFLRFLLSSESAIMWMSAIFPAAMLLYFAHLFRPGFAGTLGTAFTWIACAAGFIGLLVRWHETYLHGPAMGYFPVSNLYEVFVLFAFMTGLIYLYYEDRTATKALGGFVGLIITASIGFLLWYHFWQEAHYIEPLVPALQSWWMKIHVPTNFVGYGAFALAAMVAVAYLIRARAQPGSLAERRLPSLAHMDQIMYRAIALGFVFFTIATILGALWAAEAWGGYWTWDPKETWSLIVWLNYAAWLHMRFTKGWRGTPMAWWAIGGLLVTTFCFLGVNIFLSGLHSYGEL